MTIDAFYFGERENPLYGTLLSPTGTLKGEAVLICYPGPEEYMRMHWPLRGVSLQLASLGFPVFRFDYWGTGDSYGDTDLATAQRWLKDVNLAFDECADVTGAKKIHVLALRLGAILALQASTILESPILGKVALWDMPTSGESYLKALASTELKRAEWSRFQFESRKGEWGPEFLGVRQNEKRTSEYLHSEIFKNLKQKSRESFSESTEIQTFGLGSSVWKNHIAVEDSLFQNETTAAIVQYFSQ
jgi:pimeloyl-ACP methyl ester carboxylesterase